MKQKIITLFMVIMIFFGASSYCGEYLGDYTLYIFDELRHLPVTFKKEIKVIQEQQPDYSKREIVNMITVAYYTISMSGEDVSMQDVVDGIRMFSDDENGIDFPELVSFYVNAKLPSRAQNLRN